MFERAFVSPAMSVCVLASAVIGGCAREHRITLVEFLAADRAAPVPTPSPVDPAVISQLESRLGSYQIGPGDELTIQLTGRDGVALFPALPVRVDRSGKIDLPLVGAVAVGDREIEDAEDAVLGAYVPAVYREAVCYIAVTRGDVTNVLVVGAVPEPGLVPLPRHQRNLLYAIVGAQGVTDESSGLATLRRLRGSGEELSFDLTDPTDLRSALTLEPLEDGDIVYVHTAVPNTVFVGGLVNRPAAQAYPQGSRISVLQAVAAAGGLRTDVTPTEGTLVRHLPDGSDQMVKLDLKRIARGEEPNIQLAAGDILWVPETLGTKVEDFINRNIFLRAGVTATYSVTGVEFMNRHRLQGGRSGGGGLQDSFDPLGFLGQNAALQTIQGQLPP